MFIETDNSVVSLQKKYKVVKRQLEYMKTYARKAEDERDEAKRTLFKTQQDIARMNDQFESLRASVQKSNKGNIQASNIAAPTLPTSSVLPEKPQVIEPKENIRDSGSEKIKSVDVSTINIDKC